MQKARNRTVDVLRGLAMLLVVLGHTMSGSSVDSEKSFIYQIIWSLQMPLFFLISGYVTQYSKPMESGKSLWRYVIKKTVAYLLPWTTWTFGVRGVIFGQTNYLDVKNLLWNMDSGYWFLFALWMISMVFGFAQFAANKHTGLKNTAIICLVSILGAAILGCVGLVAGLSFLCIKLTIYYLPFYLLGHIYGKYSEKVPEKVKHICVAVGLIVWLVIILRVNLFAIEDGLVGIALRAVSSLCGCVAVSGMVANLQESVHGGGTLLFAEKTGRRSLEIYLIHYLLLNMIQLNTQPLWPTATAVALVAVNYVLTLVSTTAVANLLNTNKFLRKVLFGKA